MWFAKNKESEEIDHLAEVKEFHRQFVEPYKGKPKGCWNFEIRSLEKSFGFELPLAVLNAHGLFIRNAVIPRKLE